MRSEEAEEQKALFLWADMSMGKWPCLRLMHHIPNGGYRKPSEASHLALEGVKSGVPDICLPVPASGLHGLYIEMKRVHGGTVSPQQKEWIHALREQGYAAEVCHGFDKAKDVIIRYLRGEYTHE